MIAEADDKWRGLIEAYTDAQRQRDSGMMLAVSVKMVAQLVREGNWTDAVKHSTPPILIQWADPMQQDLDGWERIGSTKDILIRAQSKGGLSLDQVHDAFVNGARLIPIVPVPRGLIPGEKILGIGTVRAPGPINPEAVWRDLAPFLGA